MRYGFVTDALWHSRACTLQPGGVIHLARPGLTLGDAFAVWVSRRREPVAEFQRAGARVRRRRALARRSGRAVPHDRDAVALQVGAYVPPHPVFTFAHRSRSRTASV